MQFNNGKKKILNFVHSVQKRSRRQLWYVSIADETSPPIIYIEVLKSPPPSGRGLFHFSSNKALSFRLLQKYSNNSLLSAPSLLVYAGKPSNNLLRNRAVGGVCLPQISAGRLASVHLRQSIFPSSGFNSVATDKGNMQSLPLTEYAWLILLNSLQSFPLLGLLE